MKQEKNWPNIIIPFIFPAIWVVILAFTGPFLIQVANEKASSGYDTVMVTVDRADRTYKVGAATGKDLKHFNYYVSYDYNGVHYSDVLLGEHGAVKENGTYKMCIDPENPTYVFMPSSWQKIWGILFLVVDVIVIAVCVPLFIKRYKEN